MPITTSMNTFIARASMPLNEDHTLEQFFDALEDTCNVPRGTGYIKCLEEIQKLKDKLKWTQDTLEHSRKHVGILQEEKEELTNKWDFQRCMNQYIDPSCICGYPDKEHIDEYCGSNHKLKQYLYEEYGAYESDDEE
jgi:hypothetical protein